MTLRNSFRAFLAASLIASAFAIPAVAGNTVLFSSQNGDIVFPLSPPTTSPAAAGAIDNMAIGTTTPAPGKFTTFAITGTTAASGTVCTTFSTIGAPAAATDTVFFVATRAYRVVAVSEVHAVAAGGASVVQVVKDTGTNAPGAGTDLLTNNTNTGFDLNATANTVQVGALVATPATVTLAAGDRLSVDFAQAIQSSSGIAITACLAPQ